MVSGDWMYGAWSWRIKMRVTLSIAAANVPPGGLSMMCVQPEANAMVTVNCPHEFEGGMNPASLCHTFMPEAMAKWISSGLGLPTSLSQNWTRVMPAACQL